jgi:putative DNA primase/helicase
VTQVSLDSIQDKAKQSNGSNGHVKGAALPDEEWRAQLVAEMTAAGVAAPATIIADGTIHRFGPDDVCWYAVYPDPVAPHWWFGDWRAGVKQHGEADPGRVLTADEIAERKERLQAQQEALEKERQQGYADVAEAAQRRWAALKPANPLHPYLKAKQIEPFGARQDGNRLVIARRDIHGKLWSLQDIGPDGHKDNQCGGRAGGCFYQIGEVQDGAPICVCEGFSTGASIHMATRYAVFCAGYASNLVAVAKSLRRKYPHAEIIICADDDWLTKIKGKPHNTGKIEGTKAAEAVNGVLALPWFDERYRPQKATDFNDSHCRFGIGEVSTAIKLARIAHEEGMQAGRDTPEAEAPPIEPEDTPNTSPEDEQPKAQAKADEPKGYRFKLVKLDDLKFWVFRKSSG